MKRIILSITLFVVGMAIFVHGVHAQDLSYYNNLYMRVDSSFADRLVILQAVQQDEVQATPDFYLNALKYLLAKTAEINSKTEQQAAETSVIILAQALGAAKHAEAANDLWTAADYFDVIRDTFREPNEGNAQQAALIALAKVDGKTYIPHIVQRLTDFNTQLHRNAETRRRVQTAVIGCIRALEIFKDISGYRPVFFVYTGGYDTAVKQIAASALPNITDDPCDVVIEIIRDTSIIPPIKLDAWNEMFRTRAPNSSKAKVAAVALEVGWVYNTSNRTWQANLKQLRKNAIEVIRQHGVQGDNVYADLEKSYSANFISNSPDYDEITATLNALSSLKTDEAVELLHKFLKELHARRRSGPWRDKERQLFEWVVASIGFTGTRSLEVRLTLRTIQMSDQYTAQEKSMAGNALSQLGN